MIDFTTKRDLETGATTVRLDGDLTPATATTVRFAVGKAAAECPTAVLVDLTGLHHVAAHLLSVFAATAHHAQEIWGVPVLLCGAGPEIARGLDPFRGSVALYPSHWQASLAVRAYVPRWSHEHFGPVPASAAAARRLVGDACLAWDLEHMRDRANLVVSELAANAILHAATDFDVTVAYTGRYLRIAVQDGSTAMPRPVKNPKASGSIIPAGSGRGLVIIAAAATHWGSIRLPDGKIVWAHLRAHPLPPAQSPQ